MRALEFLSESFDTCYNEACRLYDQAEAKGLPARLLQVAGFQGDGSSADPRWQKIPKDIWQHYVVLVGDRVLDPTAKQFGPEFATKYNQDQLEQNWKTVYQIRPKELNEEERLLDPEEYGLELPIATVRRIVTAVMAQVDPQAVVKVRSSPEGYYFVSTDNEMLIFDFGITADGGEISANIVNAYSSYKGAGVVTKIIDLCFKAMVKKYGKPTKFVISTQQDRGDGVWQAIAQKLGAEWGGSMMENFADGKGPGRPGDSQRHGIPKGATMAELERASHSAGRKGQLARWQLNMRRGHKK